jgi:hypothetical protein
MRLRWKAITCSVTETSPNESSTPDVLRDSVVCSMKISVLRVVVAVERVDDRAAGVDVELADLVGLTEVQIDRAGVHC